MEWESVNKYSQNSEKNLATCHPDLQKLFRAVLEIYDHAITEGIRTKEDQDKYFAEGKTKLKYPAGKHCENPSKAVHALPFGTSVTSTAQRNMYKYYFFAGCVLAVAYQLNIKIRWGGDWDSDKDFSDQTFDDLMHFELV